MGLVVPVWIGAQPTMGRSLPLGHLGPMESTPRFRLGPEGFTLLELIVVLALSAISLSVLLPAARRQVDRMAVLGAQEEVAGLFHQARALALARGSSEIVISSTPPRVQLLSVRDTFAGAELQSRYGVNIGLARGRSEARLRFGPLGLGQIASQTIRFRRGEEESLLVISSLGRVAPR